MSAVSRSATPTRWSKLARRQLCHGDLPAKNGVRPHMFVNTTAHPSAARSMGAADREGSGDGPCFHAGIGLVDGQIVGGGPVSGAALERLACDATVQRVLYGPGGELLDLGRSGRVVSPAQWRALLLRDGGCVIPGHDCPAAHTEAHHLVSWLAGGPTDLANLALVCTFGHKLLHERGFTLYLDNDNRWVLRKPDGREITGLPLAQTHHTNNGAFGTTLYGGPRGPCGD